MRLKMKRIRSNRQKEIVNRQREIMKMNKNTR